MAKVYFYYSAMNAGKSTVLLQSSYNYQERGMRTLIFAPAIDHRAGLGRVKSRIGLEAPAEVLSTTDNLLSRVQREMLATVVAAEVGKRSRPTSMRTARCIACWWTKRSFSPRSRWRRPPISPTD